MITLSSRTRPERPVRGLAGMKIAAALIAGGVVTAGCASSGGSSSGAPAGGGGASSASSAATVAVHSGPMGSFLTDSSGKSLYMFASDTATKSSCNSVCVRYWPPLTTTGTPEAMSGANGKLATLTGTNGVKQVSYAGHPLYYYSGDSAPGQTNGQGSSNFGAKWWLLAPSGKPITGSAPASSSAPAGNGGGGGYGGGGGGSWG